MKWAAVATAVIALGAVSCGTSDSGTGGAGSGAASASASAAVSPRPAGTGPLTREVVRTDLDTSAAAAGAPANDPDYLRTSEAASAVSCAVAFKGFGTDAVPVDLARFEATVRELGKRAWKEAGKAEQRKDEKGEVYVSKVLLEQRGWRVVAEYRGAPSGGTIGLLAFDNACMKAHGKEAGSVG
ncbi:hypothetical protein ACFVX6_08145 [Streptomyces sp. NPDC058289]|uniref:hypothetical protein n=1 Tax=Streptomyces sp. NPDC058289 TaxID=3346425 RepID=UPI0036EF4037